MSIETEMKALAESNKTLAAAVEALTAALTAKASNSSTKTSKVETEEEASQETCYFHRKSNGELLETDDEKEIAKLRKARGVDEVDEDEFVELQEAAAEAEAEKKRKLEAAKKEKAAKSKAKTKVEEDEDLDDLGGAEEEEAEYTLADAKKILVQLKTDVGPEAVKKIFKKLKVANFGEVTEDQATEAYELAEAALEG